MGGGLYSLLDKIRQFINLDAWMVKLLKLSIIKEHSALPGAVIIQIDGLSHHEFIRAIHNKQMPNLAMLLKKEGYSEHVHFSGVPSSTPAVQGKLFYGEEHCVPAFSYKDKKSGKIFNMFVPENAAAIEKRLKINSEPLLKGGSAYGDVFTGGAKEPHFCVSADWKSLLNGLSPFTTTVFILMHLHIMIRSALLIALECILALVDFISGLTEGKNLLKEIQYIPMRVLACVIAREVTGIGAKIDIARGMNVIHLNLAGYDEQAHHRGPGSNFARWTLQGIDSVIGSIWRAAKRSNRRDYDIFIYSDHGQEETVYYSDLSGRLIKDVIDAALKDEIFHEGIQLENGVRAHNWRAYMMRNRPKTDYPGVEEIVVKGNNVLITALGPLGHIYTPVRLSVKQKTRIASKLVSFGVPLVISADGTGKVFAWNSRGRFMLPRDAAKILGAAHPFLSETAHELVKLCHHKDAGGLIFSGYKIKGKSMTFYSERGSHAGPGPNETSGFVMFPPDLGMSQKKAVNTFEIRAAVFKALKRSFKNGRVAHKSVPGSDRPVRLKIMSYNIHACMGRDGKIRPDRIARVIAGHNPDIIALQETDIRENVHQAKIIAEMLSMNYHYHSSVILKTGQHGNAVLSRFKLKLIKNGSLPSFINTPFLEKRGALWVEADINGRKVQVINTHLSLFQPEGFRQAKTLLSSEWLGNSACKNPVILCGDFNSLLNSRICRLLGGKYHSVHFHVPERRHLKSFPSFFPVGLVDHIFYGPGIKALKIEVPKKHMEKIASDHLPLIAEVRLEGKKRDKK